MATQGHKVYFINPPKFKFLKSKVEISKVDEIFIVNLTVPLPYWMKFKMPVISSKYIGKQYSRLLMQASHPNILWNFDNETYFQQEHLFNCLKIFHPVDAFENHFNKSYNDLYDFAFSVSPEILNTIPIEKKLFVNHALGKVFENLAFTRSASEQNRTNSNNKIRIGYVGNLSIRFLDHSNLLKIVSSNPGIEFNFIGNFETNDKNVDKLKFLPNTVFHGVIKGEQLYFKILDFDLLLLCYKKQPGYLGDNSHKLLEYLATGLPVFSSKLTVYKDNPLIEMAVNDDNSDYVARFNETVENLDSLKTSTKRHERIRFCT